MSVLADIDQELVNVSMQTLQTLLSSDTALIEQGQQHLKVLQVRKEYVLILVNFLLDSSNPFAVRQLAGVLFKQYIDIHWSKNAEKFEEPEVDAAVKARIRDLLPLGLSDPSSKLRTQVSVSMALIGTYDWPDSWPQLFDLLVAALNGHAIKPANVSSPTVPQPAGVDLNVVHGALETLIHLVPEVTDMQMPQVAPAIMPQMYKIFVDPRNYSIGLRKRAVQIFASLVEEIADMSEYDKSAAKKFLYPYMGDFIFAMIKLLSLTPAESVNVVDFGLKKEIIKVLTVLLKSFPKKLNNIINEILTQVWNCLVQSSEIYVTKVINADSSTSESLSGAGGNSSDVDFEDEKKSFEDLIYELFEFISVLKDKNKFKPTIKRAIDELCYYAILYMQINDDQLDNWSSNPEQFVQDEDDESYSYSIRISAEELIENISQDFKKETSSAISKALERHMENAQKMRANNDNNWWKIHEACLLAVSAMKPVFQELLKANVLEFNLNAFVNQFVIACLHESNFPFLVGRALFTASRFPKMLNAETLETLLKATGSALHESQNPIIRVSAMKSAYCFADELINENQQQILIPHLGQITDGLIQMIIQNSGNQIGTLTMETLVMVLSVDDKFVESVESKVSPLAIALFIKNTNDPLVNSIITDMIKALINNPFTYAKIEQRMMPTLISILNQTMGSNIDASNEIKDVSSLLTSTLDLITVFVRSSPQIPLSKPTMNAFGHVANLCLKTDDTAILQNGGECLRAFVSKSIEQVVAWKDERGESALAYIVHVIRHMLDPKTNENSCTYVGTFITTLIRRTEHVLGANLDAILKAVLSKIQSSQVPLVQQSLIMVFAQLVHTRMDAVLTFLSSLPGPDGKPVLEFLMTEWVNRQVTFAGSYGVKVSILALAKILEHAIATEDTRFQSIFVKGDRIINPVEGIKTRSKSKTDKELYTQVPLLVKIYKLLINETQNLMLEKAEEGNLTGDDDEEGDEEDEEDVDDDEGDDDDKDEMEDENENEGENVDAYLNPYNIFEDAFDKDDCYNEYDPDALEDPIIKIDLLEYLKNYLTTLSKHPCYKVFSEHHNNLEKQVLKEIGITNV